MHYFAFLVDVLKLWRKLVVVHRFCGSKTVLEVGIVMCDILVKNDINVCEGVRIRGREQNWELSIGATMMVHA